MKAVKIILGIIIALTIVFFATGLVVKENNYKAEVLVDKSVSETFILFNDISKIKNWIPEIKSIDTIQFNSVITGSRFKMVVDNQGQEVTMEEKVLAFIPNKKVTLFFDAEGMLKTDEYVFTSKDGKTMISMNSSFKSEDSYLLSCVFPYFKGTLKDIDQQYLDNFKAFAEK